MNNEARSTKLSLAQEIGQMLWLGYEGIEPTQDLIEQIRQGQCGGVILFSRNLPQKDDGLDIAQIASINNELHLAAPAPAEIPLWISVDQEGGLVQRIREPATRWPEMMSLAKHPPDLAFQVGLAMGRELCALGFDVDFAPVCDIHTNPKNPIIGRRAFGVDPDGVAARVAAFVRGMETAGVVTCAKHFPGHGDTDKDSHLELPLLPHSLEVLMAREFVPFRAAIEAGVSTVMTAHVVFTAFDEQFPATMVPEVLDLLRNTLGFGGLIVSDDLDMHAVSKNFPIGEAAVRAVKAGCDVLLLCRDVENQKQVFQALLDHGERDPVLRERIGVSASRIVKKKQERSLGTTPTLDVVGSAGHRQLAAFISKSA